MRAVPDALPDTFPAPSTDAVSILLLDHVPPAVVLLNGTVAPVQINDRPVGSLGWAFTVTVVDEKQPVAENV